MFDYQENAGLRDPIFKGCTRPAMFFGVPLVPLVIVGLTIIFISVWTTIFFIVVLPLFIFGMRCIANSDDQQFRLLGLKILFRLINYNHNRMFWNASVYSPFVFKKRK